MTKNIHDQRILILDFGSQYTPLIARRVREVGVYSEIRAFDMSEEDIREYDPKGIILSGGPESVAAADSPRAPQLVFELGVPVLGICYGVQTMAEQKAIIISTHILEEVEALCTRVIIIAKGRIVESGGPELAEVLERDGYAAFTSDDDDAGDASANALAGLL